MGGAATAKMAVLRAALLTDRVRSVPSQAVLAMTEVNSSDAKNRSSQAFRRG